MTGFILTEAIAAKLRVRLDAVNVCAPVPILDGPDKGMYYIDEALFAREPRWEKLIRKELSDVKLAEAGARKGDAPVVAMTAEVKR